MVKAIIWLIGLAIVGISIAIMLKPQIARGLSERMNETGFALGAWARIVVGLVFFLISDSHSWSILFKALGIILVLFGAYALHIGYERTHAQVVKIAHSNENFLRAGAAVGVLVGILLISAIAS